MSTGYRLAGKVSTRQVHVRVTLLGARHVGYLSAFVVAMSTLGAISSVRPVPLPFLTSSSRLHRSKDVKLYYCRRYNEFHACSLQ